MADEQVQRPIRDTGAAMDRILDEVWNVADVQVQDEPTDTATDADLETETAETDSEDEGEVVEDDGEAGPEEDTAAPVTDYAAAIRIVESKAGKQIADLIRGRQADWSRAENEARQVTLETKAMQAELKKTLAEIQQSLEEEPESTEQDDDTVPEGMTEEHVRAFDELLERRGRVWAERNGYVKKGDVETTVTSTLQGKDEQVARVREHQTSAVAAVGIYGDAFGKIENGRFVLNETAKARMEPVLQRLGGNAFKGTLTDLFGMTFSPEELLAFKQKAKPPVNGAAPGVKVAKLRKAGSADVTSSTASTKPKIYTKGKDTFDKVFERAYQLAELEIGLRHRR